LNVEERRAVTRAGSESNEQSYSIPVKLDHPDLGGCWYATFLYFPLRFVEVQIQWTAARMPPVRHNISNHEKRLEAPSDFAQITPIIVTLSSIFPWACFVLDTPAAALGTEKVMFPVSSVHGYNTATHLVPVTVTLHSPGHTVFSQYLQP
jgi:hypothetical protein